MSKPVYVRNNISKMMYNFFPSFYQLECKLAFLTSLCNVSVCIFVHVYLKNIMFSSPKVNMSFLDDQLPDVRQPVYESFFVCPSDRPTVCKLKFVYMVLYPMWRTSRWKWPITYKCWPLIQRQNILQVPLFICLYLKLMPVVYEV